MLKGGGGHKKVLARFMMVACSFSHLRGDAKKRKKKGGGGARVV